MSPRHSLRRVACSGLLLAGVAVASGCAAIRPTGNVITERPAAVSVDGLADWSWNISGDALVRPLQVFSLQGQTYFQMQPRQRIPVIFVNGKPVPFTVSPPYLIVRGTPSRFDFIANGYRAVIVHRGPVAMPVAPVIERTDRVRRVNDVSAGPVVGDAAADDALADEGSIGSFVARNTLPPTRTVTHAEVDVAKAIAKAPTPDADTRRVWRITPSQKTLSRALAAWSQEVGVELVWKSDVDLPIQRPAEYRVDKFFAAMSDLLADAGSAGYRFFYSVDGRTVTVISVKQS